MFGSCQFLCLFIACLFSVFLKSFVYLLPVCVIFWVTFCSLSLCSNSCHWVECFLLTGQGTVSSVCFCLLQTWSKSLGLFFQDVLCICLFFRVSYRYRCVLDPSLLPVPLLSPQISFSCLGLVLFIDPHKLIRPVYVTLNLEQAIRAWVYHYYTPGYYASPFRICCLLIHQE